MGCFGRVSVPKEEINSWLGGDALTSLSSAPHAVSFHVSWVSTLHLPSVLGGDNISFSSIWMCPPVSWTPERFGRAGHIIAAYLTNRERHGGFRLIIDSERSFFTSFVRSISFFSYTEGARERFSKWEWCEAHAGLASRRRSLSSQPVRTDKHFSKTVFVQTKLLSFRNKRKGESKWQKKEKMSSV